MHFAGQITHHFPQRAADAFRARRAPAPGSKASQTNLDDHRRAGGHLATTLYNAEAGDGAVTLGTYLRVMAALGLEKDFELLAADDVLGRKLQDLSLEPKRNRS